VCTPYVIEPALGLNRLLLAMFCDGLREEEVGAGDSRTVFHCQPELAPTQAAILPLTKGDALVADSQALLRALQPLARCSYDAAGSIGKRYRRGDEEGTPLCITVDHSTRSDSAVTLRDRDSMRQVRVAIAEVVAAAGRGQLKPSTWFKAL
jgi:glycyl-tRNA synthetase